MQTDSDECNICCCAKYTRWLFLNAISTGDRMAPGQANDCVFVINRV